MSCLLDDPVGDREPIVSGCHYECFQVNMHQSVAVLSRGVLRLGGDYMHRMLSLPVCVSSVLLSVGALGWIVLRVNRLSVDAVRNCLCQSYGWYRNSLQ